MNRGKLVKGLLLIDAGIFVLTAGLLPKAGSFSYSNALERFINSREHWDIALAVFLSSLLITIGLIILFGKDAE